MKIGFQEFKDVQIKAQLGACPPSWEHSPYASREYASPRTSARDVLEGRLQLEPQGALNYDIWDLIIDDNGNPRLKRARAEFLPLTRERLSTLMEAHRFWSNHAEYLHLENRKTGENVYVKCSKRGNDVYNWRLENSLSFLRDLKNFEVFSLDSFKTSSILKLDKVLIWRTLTFDSKLTSLDEAWNNSSENFERWITRIKRRYGEENVSYIAFIQPFPGNGLARGYPHYHVLLLIENNNFHVYRDMEDEGGVLKMVYRLVKEEEQELDRVGDWHSPVQDTKVLRNGAHVYNYCFKYIQNVVTGSCWSESEDPSKPGAYEKSSITNSILWLKRKRAFTMSGDFRESYSRLIRALHNSKPKQVDLDGEIVPPDRSNPPPRSEWRLVGIISGSELEERLGRSPRWVEVVPGSSLSSHGGLNLD